jgi:hypothetical protein
MATVFAEWRFLLLTLLICAYLLPAPLIAGSWLVQMVLEALLLAMVLVTLSANPGWSRLRRVLVVLRARTPSQRCRTRPACGSTTGTAFRLATP